MSQIFNRLTWDKVLYVSGTSLRTTVSMIPYSSRNHKVTGDIGKRGRELHYLGDLEFTLHWRVLFLKSGKSPTPVRWSSPYALSQSVHWGPYTGSFTLTSSDTKERKEGSDQTLYFPDLSVEPRTLPRCGLSTTLPFNSLPPKSPDTGVWTKIWWTYVWPYISRPNPP